MAKLTSSRVLGMIKHTCDVHEWKFWVDPKGNEERTKINRLIALCCVKDCLNTVSVFDVVYPDGVAPVIEKFKEKFETFRQQFIREYPDDFIAYSLVLDLAPLGATKYNAKKDPPLEVEKFGGKQKEAEEEPKQVDSEYKGLTLRELRKLCRERDITVPSGAKEEDLIALLEEQDESGEQPDDNEESEAEESNEEEEVKPAPKKQPAKKVEEPEDTEEELEEAEEEPAPKKKPQKVVEEPDEDNESEEDTDEQSEQSQSSEEAEDEDVEEASPYDEMELDELCEECDRRGIEYKKGAKAHVLIELLTQDDKNSAESNEDEEEIQKEVDELDELLDENFVDEEIEAVAQEESNAKVAKAKKNKK